MKEFFIVLPEEEFNKSNIDSSNIDVIDSSPRGSRIFTVSIEEYDLEKLNKINYYGKFDSREDACKFVISLFKNLEFL